MFIGFTGSAFNKNVTIEVNIGSSFQLGHYNLTLTSTQDGENENFIWRRAMIAVTRGGESLGTMEPERRIYKVSQQPTSEVAIRRRLNEDLYLNFARSNDDTHAVIQAYVFPLVSWIWIGYYVILFGTLICLVPSKTEVHILVEDLVPVCFADALGFDDYIAQPWARRNVDFRSSARSSCF